MDNLWSKARSFAEEAAKRSNDLTIGSSKLGDIVTEASKRADQIKIEAVKRAEQIRSEAVKRADQIIKSTSPSTANAIASAADHFTVVREDEGDQDEELYRYGITEELRDFVSEITMNTFKDFPIEDDSEMADVPAVSNISQDLTEWQTKHVSLVLKTVKEIGKLRYELCPRIMKERKFWRIYFILVNSHVSPYEKRCMDMEDKKQKPVEPEDEKLKEPTNVETKPKPDKMESKSQKKNPAEHDLDVFLLGEDSDGDDRAGKAVVLNEIYDVGVIDCGEEARDDDIDEFMESSTFYIAIFARIMVGISCKKKEKDK
ncbi:hypothetical protein ACFE04_010123 [Oxalis oulophora]